MLSCKQVAAIANDYLDEGTLNNKPLKWQMRLHLLMCANCRRFVRHLNITKQLSAGISHKTSADQVEAIWQKLQAHLEEESQQKKL